MNAPQRLALRFVEAHKERRIAVSVIILAIAAMSAYSDTVNILNSFRRISNPERFNALVNTWISARKIINDTSFAFQDTYRITLKSNSRFATFYRPDNYHEGQWYLNSDSSFVLSLKATEIFKIIELTDSTLMVQPLWGEDSSKIEFKAKNYSKTRLCVFISLNPPFGTNGAKLQKMLKAEGYSSDTMGAECISLVLSEKQIKTLLSAKVRYKTVAASSHHGTVSEAFLEGVIIPARFRKLISRIFLDPML
jgi:hypothetical protein